MSILALLLLSVLNPALANLDKVQQSSIGTSLHGCINASHPAIAKRHGCTDNLNVSLLEDRQAFLCG